ncbi:Clp protease [uncultured Selenomonas sp.]|uniref:Clp protease n=1 Tax=uncultured Selenomonas sp. TaxID=159275 RepID=UPI0028E580B2|nr:Clp protease [uncultured Selenomonas sp.]
MMATTEMTDDMVVQGARAAVRIALAKNKARGVSSVAYDRKTKTIYEIRSDGQRVPIWVECDGKRAEEA